MRMQLLCVAVLLLCVSKMSGSAFGGISLSPTANGFVWNGTFDLGLGAQIATMDGVPDGYWDQNALKPFLIVERVQSTAGLGPVEVRSALEFDLLSVLPQDATIQSASLRLATHSAGDPIANSIQVWGYGSNLKIGLDDYDQPAQLLGYANLAGGELYSTQTDVTNFVRSALVDGYNPGFRLQVSPSYDSLSVVFSSTRNFSDINPPPYLEIQFSVPPPPPPVPEPASLAIWGSLGLTGLATRWRRRGKQLI